VPAEAIAKVRQPIGSPGGKSRIADRLVALLPEHTTYVEPFAGGAAVFWAKEPSKHEVLNDIDPDIMAVYRFLKSATDAELEAFAKRDWVGKESLFEHLVAARPTKLADRAYRAWYLARFGYLGIHSRTSHYRHANDGQTADVTITRLRELRERLRHVTLRSTDAIAVIQEYDSPNTVFYLDPPYIAANAGYRNTVDETYLAKLGAALKNIKGRALISGNAATIDAMRLPASWQRRKLALTYTIRDDPRRRFEWLAANYSIQKATEPPGEGGETRGEAALRNWEQHWHEAMPLSGKALPFILHAHWRGLTEAEAQLDMDALLRTDNSLHFDLRLGTDRFHGWWGISLFAGTTAENRPTLRIFRMQQDAEERLESAPKEFGPAAWLTVGRKAPLVVPPGGVGSTARAWSKFVAIDYGTWRLGMARQHGVEVWLQGRHVQGRFLWQYAPIQPNGPRQWLFTRPEDQRPYAATHELGAVLQELHSKGQRWLVWPKDPAHLEKGLRLLDVPRVWQEYQKYTILKAEPEQRYTLGVAYPAERVDAHGDYTTPEQLEQAAWHFLERVQAGTATIGLMHQPGRGGEGRVVESYIYRGPEWQVGQQMVRPGDWLLGVIWTPAAWERIKRGEITGYSIQGWARRKP
jgi:site-specific DNA-adenine methylase